MDKMTDSFDSKKWLAFLLLATPFLLVAWQRAAAGVPAAESAGALAALIALFGLPGMHLGRFCFPTARDWPQQLIAGVPMAVVAVGLTRLGLRMFLPHPFVAKAFVWAWIGVFAVLTARSLAIRLRDGRPQPRQTADLRPFLPILLNVWVFAPSMPSALKVSDSGIVMAFGGDPFPWLQVPLVGEIMRSDPLQSTFMAGGPQAYWPMLVAAVNATVVELTGAEPFYVQLGLLTPIGSSWIAGVIAAMMTGAFASRPIGFFAGIATYFSVSGLCGTMYYLEIHQSLAYLVFVLVLYSAWARADSSPARHHFVLVLGLPAIFVSNPLLFLACMAGLGLLAGRDALVRRDWRDAAALVAAGAVTLLIFHGYSPTASSSNMAAQSPLDAVKVLDDEFMARVPLFKRTIESTPGRLVFAVLYPLLVAAAAFNIGLLALRRTVRAARGNVPLRRLGSAALAVCAACALLPMLIDFKGNLHIYPFFWGPLFMVGGALTGVFVAGLTDWDRPAPRRAALAIGIVAAALFSTGIHLVLRLSPHEQLIDKPLYDTAQFLRRSTPEHSVVLHRPEHARLPFFSMRRSFFSPLDRDEFGKFTPSAVLVYNSMYGDFGEAARRAAVVARVFSTADPQEVRSLLEANGITHVYSQRNDAAVDFDKTGFLTPIFRAGSGAALFEFSRE